MIKNLFIALLLIISCVSNIQGQTKWRFSKTIQAFQKEDSNSFPKKGGILFVGSSSIGRWNDLEKRFKGYNIIRRGFGGAEYIEILHYAEDIIIPYKPSSIFLYAGENDFARGKTVEGVYEIFVTLYHKIRKELPQSTVFYISVKPSNKLKAFRLQIEALNKKILKLCESQKDTHLKYIDVFHSMIDKNGEPINELFANDQLHLSTKGYDLWEKALRKQTDIFDTSKRRVKKKDTFYIPPFHPKEARKPQYPLKTKRMLYTKDDLNKALKNIKKYPKARKIKENIIKKADKWVNMADEDILKLMPDARVPRAFDLNVNGCPIHGKEVFNKGGSYPWIIDPASPFKVKCPVGGEVYPTNDYESYYESGFKERNGWDTKYVDDGWGWVAPDGERYWFVAYANHWLWHGQVNPAILNLSRAYLLSKDEKYAHKAALMLYRLAEVYPEMDYKDQSRYGLMVKRRGGTYNGKVVNYIWETSFIQHAAESYDNIWESIDKDDELQKRLGKTGEEIRSFIEANLLEEAIDAYFEGKIQGNYGMHQLSLLYILLTRQNIDIEKYIQLLVKEPGKDRAHTGIRYALYNQIFRDGQAFESPGYNLIWVGRLAALSEMLKKAGVDLTKYKRLKMLLDSPLEMLAIGKYTIDLGDTGSPLGGVQGRSLNTYQIGYAEYQDPRYLDWMGSVNLTGKNSFSTFESLFREPLPKTKKLSEGRAQKAQPSRLFAGYGVGILNNKKDKTAVAFTYGRHISHYHWDFLSFGLFANGQKMMPDLGYPDAMNVYVPGIYSWSKNTISHNTVVVDEKKQVYNAEGVLHDFATGSFARIIDASSPTYPQTQEYRRNLMMVDVDNDQSYVVDFFRVSGGTRHTYSLHGPPGEVEVTKGRITKARKGTFAGENVMPGQFYDAPQYNKEDYDGGYSGYSGSGFQHLFHVQEIKGEEREKIIEYRHIRDSSARLRMHLLNYEPQKTYLADAYGKPRAKDFAIKYVLVDRIFGSKSKEHQSTFLSVLEPFVNKPYVKEIKLLNFKKSGKSSIALEVSRGNETDIIINDTDNEDKILKEYNLETDATNMIVTIDKSGDLKRLFFSNGTFVRFNGKEYRSQSFEGIIKKIDYDRKQITVELDKNYPFEITEKFPLVAHFSNKFHHLVHPIKEYTREDNKIVLEVKDDLFSGLALVDSIQSDIIFTSTYLPFLPSYVGGTVLNEEFQPLAKIVALPKGHLKLDREIFRSLTRGNDFWIATVGVGDKVEIKASFSLEKE